MLAASAVLAARLAGSLQAAATRCHHAQALLREPTQRATQAKADATPPRCPVCAQPLLRCSSAHARTFQTRFGDITVHRTHGTRARRIVSNFIVSKCGQVRSSA